MTSQTRRTEEPRRHIGHVLFYVVIGMIAMASIVWALMKSEEGAKLTSDATTRTEEATPAGGKTIIALGDMVCDPSDPNFNMGAGSNHRCSMDSVSSQVIAQEPDFILALGDLQYNAGTLDAFMSVFDRWWGSVKSRILPVPGNHEYGTPDAAGFFSYFQETESRYGNGLGNMSMDLNGWHLIGLNSNCDEVGGCDEGSPQMQWLNEDLAAHPAACTIAFFHHPRFTSGRYAAMPSQTSVRSAAIWKVLRAAGVDIIVNGHDHLYERFEKLDGVGIIDPQGIRQFTVGTGGKELYQVTTRDLRSAVVRDDVYGFLRLSLKSTEYGWDFISADGSTKGQVLDHGVDSCSN